jgi:hypothetical protein
MVVRGQQVGGPKTEIAGFANALSINPAMHELSAASQASPDGAVVLDRST